MYKNRLLFLALIFSLLIFSCSKDKDDVLNKDIDEDENVIPDRTKIPAFPGAEGGGMYTIGGAGGKVYKVTSLEDSSVPGTLRYAIDQREKRTVVFEVSGTIKLTRSLKITNSNITIAGQSAPEGGITITNYPVIVDADNVIIRFLRFRMGSDEGVEGDALEGRRRKNIIIDHCSMSWATDECASFYDNQNFTMQWSIVAESLNRSAHAKGDHGYGGLWGGVKATFHHNLVAHHKSRNPRFYGVRDGIKDEYAELINNVIYNWGDNSSYGGEGGQYNIINNYYKAGPGTMKHKNRIFEAYKGEDYGKFYVNGNYVHTSSAVTENNWLGFDVRGGGLKDDLKLENPIAVEFINIETAEEAFESVLSHAGMSIYRDAVDERVVDETRNGTATYGGVFGAGSGIIDSVEDVGGWPIIESVVGPKDTDGDGIPDAWEIENRLDPDDPADGAKYSLNENYTNLEVYLNKLVSDKIDFGK